MNILIPNSWLKDYLETDATPEQFAAAMSLSSVSIERMEKIGNDVIFDIEVTTNRPDLMSIEGIAREASAVLPQRGYKAVFKPLKKADIETIPSSPLITITNDSSLVNRILAVVCEIDLKPSPELVSSRLEKTGIRSINNVVDITNYIMRQTGHPAHVFDYDRLTEQKLIIRKSKPGEKIVTLDDKEYTLAGGDIVADDGTGTIVDLLGIMGTANSVVTDNTKRIVLFLDNNNPHILRKTSMNLGIRTEAAVLNEKGVDPEIMIETMALGIELLKQNANAKLLTKVIDIYPNKPAENTIKVSLEKIKSIMGIEVEKALATDILTRLGFKVKSANSEFIISVPTIRINDVSIGEDIIEEIARVYGYDKIPNILPSFPSQAYYHQEKDEFYWITTIKTSMRNWGFNEVYTYSMVSEDLFDGPIEDAIALKNPLTEDRVYLRRSLTPSVLEALSINKNREDVRLFEISNVYIKEKGLPDERLHLAGVLKHDGANFLEGKGVVERIFELLGISDATYQKKDDGVEGATVLLAGESVGNIEVLDEVTFELDLVPILKKALAHKNYLPPAKYPPVIEDVRVEVPGHYSFQRIAKTIKDVSDLVYDVALLDVYKNKKTFRITYQDRSRNLTNEDITPIREKVYASLTEQFKAVIG